MGPFYSIKQDFGSDWKLELEHIIEKAKQVALLLFHIYASAGAANNVTSIHSVRIVFRCADLNLVA